MRNDNPLTAQRSTRDKISQILVKNNLRTDQVAIGELHALVMDAFERGREFQNDNR